MKNIILTKGCKGTKMKEYKKILKQLKREELEEFTLENIIQNLSIREKFEIQFSRIFS